MNSADSQKIEVWMSGSQKDGESVLVLGSVQSLVVYKIQSYIMP